MSKYDQKASEEKRRQLKELVRTYKKTQDEILPLQTYLNVLEGQIKDIVKELKEEKFDGVELIQEYDTYVDLIDLYEKHKDVFKHAIAKIDEKSTLSYMYENNIDFRIAKQKLEKAIQDTKIKEGYHERIKIKN